MSRPETEQEEGGEVFGEMHCEAADLRYFPAMLHTGATYAGSQAEDYWESTRLAIQRGS